MVREIYNVVKILVLAYEPDAADEFAVMDQLMDMWKY